MNVVRLDHSAVPCGGDRSRGSARPGSAMNTIKTLWASVQGDPVFMRRVNGWMTVFWIAMIPVSLLTGWINSVTYVAGLSLWALVSGHWSAWQAARVEVEQQREIEEPRSESDRTTRRRRTRQADHNRTSRVLATRRGRCRSLGMRVAGPHRTRNIHADTRPLRMPELRAFCRVPIDRSALAQDSGESGSCHGTTTCAVKRCGRQLDGTKSFDSEMPNACPVVRRWREHLATMPVARRSRTAGWIYRPKAYTLLFGVPPPKLL